MVVDEWLGKVRVGQVGTGADANKVWNANAVIQRPSPFFQNEKQSNQAIYVCIRRAGKA